MHILFLIVHMLLQGLGVNSMYKDEVVTWQADQYLDGVYEMLRQAHEKVEHRNASNYVKAHIKELTAKSIYWDDAGEPMIVSSILNRKCWPSNVFRVLNRAWKPFMNIESAFEIHKGWYMMLDNQIKWCFERKASGIFISRTTITPRMQRWGNELVKKRWDMEFVTPVDKYLTCENPSNPDCWQRIFYLGDNTLLQQWQSKKDDNK